jgi:hypothetical protein
MRLLRRADPDRGRADVPTIDGIDYLAALRRRSTTVTLIDIEPAATQPEGRHRWPIIAVAAAAVVAIVVGAVMLAAREDSEPPVPADTTVATVAPDVPDDATAAEEVARGFLDTYAANDADQARTYITESAIGASWGTVEEFRGDLAWNAATGYKIVVSDCELLDDDPEAGVSLRCGFDFHQLGSDALGIGPYGDNFWDLTVRDGEIVSASSEGNPNPWITEMLLPFNDWIKAEHPDDVLVMYTDNSQEERRLTDEALQLWEQRTQEYVQAVLTIREAYAADVGAICATRGPELGELAVPAEGALDQVATENTAAAAILAQTYEELKALDAPPSTDTTTYQDFRNKLHRLGRIAEDSVEAATAGDTTRLAELDAEYHEVRQTMTGGPAGSGLEECLASLPS